MTPIAGKLWEWPLTSPSVPNNLNNRSTHDGTSVAVGGALAGAGPGGDAAFDLVSHLHRAFGDRGGRGGAIDPRRSHRDAGPRRCVPVDCVSGRDGRDRPHVSGGRG